MEAEKQLDDKNWNSYKEVNFDKLKVDTGPYKMFRRCLGVLKTEVL